jgi:FkbM family methyltransferase
MKQRAARLINSSLGHFGFRLIRSSTLEQLTANVLSQEDIALLIALPTHQLPQLMKYRSRSKAQFRQDLFVLSQLDFKRDGYFVEFGATDGIHGSNTYLLEKEFGWNGIGAEPAKCWHSALRNNRSCHVETRCVWVDSKSVLEFWEDSLPAFSTIVSYAAGDFQGNYRHKHTSYGVNTISLNDLLATYGAPRDIDYLSIDTEGSEYEILNSFDFSKHRFSVITCEHNYAPSREKIYSLLTRNGYVRKFEQLSKVDDWYIRPG